MSGILTIARSDVKGLLHQVDRTSPPFCACLLTGVQPTGIVASATRYSETVPADVWSRLPTLEQNEAECVGAARVPSFVAGRIALRHALENCGLHVVEGIGINSDGAPKMPRGFVGSVAHTKDLAVAIAAPDNGEALGVDIERLGAMRSLLECRILGSEEARSCERLPPDTRNAEVTIRFAVKEAAFKAVSGLLGGQLEYEDLQILGTYSHRLGIRPVRLRSSGSFADVTLRCTVAIAPSLIFATCRATRWNSAA